MASAVLWKDPLTRILRRYANMTTGMSKMNPGVLSINVRALIWVTFLLMPGLDVHGDHKILPPLTNDPELGLVDYIVKVLTISRVGICSSASQHMSM